MILLKELFSPFGKRKRVRFFTIYIVCSLLIGLIEVQIKNFQRSSLDAFFLFSFFLIFWILLVNFIKRIRDMKLNVSYCLSEWAFGVLISWSFCFFFLPSSGIYEKEKNNPAVRKL